MRVVKKDLFIYIIIFSIFLSFLVIFYHNRVDDKRYSEELEHSINKNKKKGIFF
jgi:hypothetical protein